MAGWLAEIPQIGPANAIAGLLTGSATALLVLAAIGENASPLVVTLLALAGKMFNAGAFQLIYLLPRCAISPHLNLDRLADIPS